jgi:hypothetical protein
MRCGVTAATPISVATPSARDAAIRRDRMFFLSCWGSDGSGGLVTVSCEHEYRLRVSIVRRSPFPGNT